MSTPPILLTGATGFIGGCLAARLAREDRPLRCLVRAGSDSAGLRALDVELRVGDLCAPATLREAASGCAAVVHCAALVSDWATVAEIRAANVAGTAALLDAARAGGARRFVLLSSTDVYGHPGGAGIGEDRAPGPFANWYAQSKLEAERLVAAAQADGALEGVVLRPATVYGAGSREVVLQIARALQRRQMLLIDGGRHVAGLCYVENLLDAIVAALELPLAAGATFNVTDGLALTWRDFTDDLAARLGCPPARLSLPYGVAAPLGLALEQGYRLLRRATGLSVAPLLSRQAVQVLGIDQSFSSERAREQLGWEPRTGYADGLERTVAWLRAELGRRGPPNRVMPPRRKAARS
ncbi:MAG: NAD-dependent epimerase/dehydratase family protein [Solirubrobacteraceae bacterium]